MTQLTSTLYLARFTVRRFWWALLPALVVCLCLIGGVVVVVSGVYVNIETIKRDAARGDSSAQQRLSRLYWDGVDAPHSFGLVAQDRTKALYWMRRAAQSGDPNGALGLARLYEKSGTTKNRDAMHWYQTAANAGQPDAAKRLAEVFEKGLLGQKRSTQAALFWNRKADANQRALNQKSEREYQALLKQEKAQTRSDKKSR